MVDFSEELSQIRTARAVRKRKRYSKSRLDKFKFEILGLQKEGASLADIQFFLTGKRVKVALSTIQRWLKKHG